MGWVKVLNILRRHNLQSLRIKFIAIYLLNVADIVFTLILLSTGQFIEANGVMRYMIENEVLSIGIKVVIPLVLFLILNIRIQKATERQLIISNTITNYCLIVYAIINVSHCVFGFSYLILAWV